MIRKWIDRNVLDLDTDNMEYTYDYFIFHSIPYVVTTIVVIVQLLKWFN